MEGQNVNPDIRLMVCVPSGGSWHSATAVSVAQAIQHFSEAKYAGNKEINLVSIVSSILPESRQRLVGEAWKWDATHLVFVDSDMRFPPDAFIRLIQHGQPIVGVNYPRKKLNGLPTAYCEDDDLIGNLFIEEGAEGLREVKHMGFGLCMIDMRVFEALDFPLFAFEPVGDGFKFRGEDVYFFDKCRKVGIIPQCDLGLSEQCAHVGDFDYTHAFARAARTADAKEAREVRKKEINAA